DDEDKEREVTPPSPASWITISPTAGRALVQVNNDIYMVTIPQTGKLINLSVADAASTDFPARKLTEVGGEFPYWENDGKRVHWSLGSTHFVYDVDRAQIFEDSVKDAKKAEAKRIEDSTLRVNADSVLKKQADAQKKLLDSLKAKDTTAKKDKKKEDPKYKAEEADVKVYFKKATPTGIALLKGARIVT